MRQRISKMWNYCFRLSSVLVEAHYGRITDADLIAAGIGDADGRLGLIESFDLSYRITAGVLRGNQIESDAPTGAHSALAGSNCQGFVQNTSLSLDIQEPSLSISWQETFLPVMAMEMALIPSKGRINTGVKLPPTFTLILLLWHGPKWDRYQCH